jgi:opacity protein-like surface antigen
MRTRLCLLPSTFCLCTVALLLFPARADADITGFLGVTITPANRPVKGFAVGAGLLIVGFEFEYATTSEDLSQAAPALKTYMFNGLVQTPFAIAGIQPYATIGGGLYHETLSAPVSSETSFGTNVGGGAKISLAGPLRVRVDYRVFNLRGSPLHATVQRFYAGINLKF